MTWDTIFIMSIISAAGYFIFCLILVAGILRLPRGISHESPSVSIIVAARNEGKNIATCIHALAAQNYPPDKYEIIIVDDRSEDATAEIVRRFTATHSNVHLVQIQRSHPSMSPKKHALQHGISRSRGEIIFTTDADCIPGPDWIRATLSCFTPDVGFTAGFSPLHAARESNKLLEAFIAIDALGLAVMSAGSIGLGWGTTCTARNLAYRKKVYDAIEGFTRSGSYISGDDDLMLHAVRRETKWRIAYAIHPDASVPSAIIPHLKGIYHQRIRHASKFKAYPWDIRALGIGMYLHNLLLIFSLAGLFISEGMPLPPFYSLGLKISGDLVIAITGKLIFKTPVRLYYVPLISLMHSLYVIIIGALGVRGKFQWKGATFRTEMESK